MAEIDAQALAVARVYSDAMLKLAHSQGEADRLLTELGGIAELVEKDDEFRAFLSSPLVDVASRATTLDKMFRGRISDLLVDSLQVLNRKERLALIPAIAHACHVAHEELQGRIEVQVTTAAPLNNRLRSRLGTVLSEYTGKQTDLIERVDRELVGGLLVQVGDRKIDASIAFKLRSLADVLLERASREIHSGRTYLEGSAG